MENIQHDYFIWEENSYTEQKKNDKNNNEFVHCVTTTTTKNDLTQKDWKDITNPKERQKAYRKAYREVNKDKIKAQNKNYRQLNKDKIKVKNDVYVKLNKDKIKVRRKCYQEANKDKIKEYSKSWYKINRDKIIVQKKAYREVNKDKLKLKKKAYYKNRLKTNIQYKLSHYLRARLKTAIKFNYKSGSAVKDLGCTVEQLKQYLESKFQPEMTWDNWTVDGWHIDHIKPLASFDLTDRNQLLEACHYTNLQPLWAKDNLSKGDSVSNL